MVYNYKKQRSPIVPMYTILCSTDGVLEKNGGETRAAKQQIRKIEDTPAPNSYSLPYMVGKRTPYWGYRGYWGRPYIGSIYEDSPKAPAPGTYYTTEPDVFKKKAPHYSMTSRNYMPRYDNWTPGPGTNSPDYVTISRKASPMYSFGIRPKLPHAPIIVDKPE